MANIYSATPGTVSLGVNDQSTRSVPFASERIPQKVDLYYILAQKGTPERFFGTMADAKVKFGSETFEEFSPYFTHQTNLLSTVAGAGGAFVLQRIIPEDAGVRANVGVFLDVIDTMVPNYKRNSTGFYALEQGNKVLDTTKAYVPGRYIKWFRKSYQDEKEYGSFTVAEGSMAKWKMLEEDVHVLVKDSDDIENQSSGHTKWSNKTVYTYASQEDMYQPKASTTRKKYTVDARGGRTQEGDETFNGDNIVKSKLYPIFQVKASAQGAWYNQFGFGISSLRKKELSQAVIKGLKTLQYKFSYYVKENNNTTARPIKNLYGDTGTLVTFKKDSLDPQTGLNLSFEYGTDDMYFNTTDASKAIKYDEVENLFFYRENFEKVLKDAIVDEIPHVSITPSSWADSTDASTYSWYDFTTYKPEALTDEFGLINPFTATTSQAVPLFSLMYNDAPLYTQLDGFKEINLVSGNPILLENGSDGTMSTENYEKLIMLDLENYLDEEHVYQDQARSIENFLWDTGFSLEVKNKMSNFIALRHDRFVGYATHYDSLGESSLSLAEQSALGTTLFNNVKLNIESTEFGTPTIRGLIALGTGRTIQSKKRLPILIDLVKKITLLMGGADTRWKPQYLFDSGEKNVIEDLIDVQPGFIPPSVRDALVDSGVTYPQNYGRTSYFFPATRTVYEDQTSIATSLINMLAIPYCERVAFEVWRELTGTTSLTSAQFVSEVKNRANRKLAGAFSGVITPIAEAVITEKDEALGYLWRLEITLAGNNAKHKQIYSTRLVRSPIETK